MRRIEGLAGSFDSGAKGLCRAKSLGRCFTDGVEMVVRRTEMMRGAWVLGWRHCRRH